MNTNLYNLILVGFAFDAIDIQWIIYRLSNSLFYPRVQTIERHYNFVQTIYNTKNKYENNVEVLRAVLVYFRFWPR